MEKPLADILKERASGILAKQPVITPHFFRLSNTEDKRALEKLLTDTAAIEVYDSLHSQLVELIKIRNIGRAATPEQINDLVSQYTNGKDLEAIGVWVYYPWLNKVVHVLDEEEFIEVRTNRNQHKITAGELALLRKKKIGVIGLSVGQSIAFTVVLERCCGEIRLADFDDIELSNLNRIKTGLYNLGISKIVQTAREIAELDPFINVICYKEGITEENIDDFLIKDGKLDVLIEECDSLDVKIICRQKAKQFGIPVVMETNDRGMIDIERYDLDPSYPLLHNIVDNIPVNQLKNLTTEQKVPVMMKLVGFNTVSPRGKVTLIELGQSLATWPQLGSSVVMGGGMVADVTRRILLNHLTVSGRFYIDIENIIRDKQPAPALYTPPVLNSLSIGEMRQIAGRLQLNNNSAFAPPADMIRAIVADACTAPSSGNDQPWKFLFYQNRLFLFHATDRSHSFGDYRNMASYISFGALIENLVLSAHHHQLEITTQLFPVEEEEKCIALFTFKNEEGPATEKHIGDNLYPYLYERNTNRKVVPNDPAPAEILEQLTSITETVENARVTFISDKARLQKLGAIISACDRMRVMHPQGHYDFFHREMRWSAEEAASKRNGMDVNTLELPMQAQIALQVIRNDSVMRVLKDINGMQAFKWVSIPNAVNSAAMGLIEMPGYTKTDFINGGRAAQRQWLKSTQLGYAYHPMIVPLYLFPRIIFGNGEGLDTLTIEELQQLRKEFMELFPGNEKRGEVFLFRIFKAEKIKQPSLRLPLDDILYFQHV